jgi:hypothetical protein
MLKVNSFAKTAEEIAPKEYISEKTRRKQIE